MTAFSRSSQRFASELHSLSRRGKLNRCGVEDSGGVAIRLRLHGVVAQVRSACVCCVCGRGGGVIRVVVHDDVFG